MSLIKKLFCLHDWKSYAKKIYEYTESRIVPGSETWINPIIEKDDYSETVEILVCEKCGKIKTIEY